MSLVVLKKQQSRGKQPLAKEIVEAFRLVIENKDQAEAQEIIRKCTKLRVIK